MHILKFVQLIFIITKIFILLSPGNICYIPQSQNFSNIIYHEIYISTSIHYEYIGGSLEIKMKMLLYVSISFTNKLPIENVIVYFLHFEVSNKSIWV